MNIKQRAVGLAATVGLLGGLFAVSAPAAHAVQVADCHNLNFVATLTPPLAGDGSVNPTVVAAKAAKVGQRAWGVAFSFVEVATAGTCDILATSTGTGTGTFTDAKVASKMSGVATCVAGSTAGYPLNGKIKFSYNLNLQSEQAYIRVAGFDPVPGPDAIAITGVVTKGDTPGATVSGDVAFDPVLQAQVLNDPVAIAQATAIAASLGVPRSAILPDGAMLKKDYFFDNSQAGPGQCGTAVTGQPIGLVWGGDGTSLLGSDVSGGLIFSL